ncbi:MAG: aminomethyl-transferring glycine dehydrogenase subunit GcvPB [Clostridiales bacterium]|nr:aminomethyl-transferring glycine dehydrogenase subunit GcvPB [Clostridiales bacterium]
MREYNKLIFECSKEGRKAYNLPKSDVPSYDLPSSLTRKEAAKLPEVSEVDVIRHYTNLSQKNYAVDLGIYPLGSCTMKYNPKINEEAARMAGCAQGHPLQPAETAQGALQLMWELEDMLCKITGMTAFSMQPSAGAQGEALGLMIIRAYHQSRGDSKRNKIIVPDSAHGTNPASAAMVGMDVVEVRSNEDGGVDVDALKEILSDEIAGLMLTNPSTLGLFEKNIVGIADAVHEAGGLLYYDGANANAIMGITRPGDMGFDVLHLNLHKTFSTPHGGGGPGAGPVGVAKHLEEFLPVPVITKKQDKYDLDYDRPLSVGKVKGFYGNFGVLVRAYTYILTMGAEGLKRVSEMAVLNANYMMDRLKEYYELPYDQTCMHEFVISYLKNNPADINTKQIAKRLLDFGVHPPTTYFPLIVHEAMMIEPTETESLESMDEYISAMIQIAKEAVEDPEIIQTAPHNTPIKLLDEVSAARNPVVKW